MNDERIIELYWQRSEQAIQLSGEHYGDYCFTIAHNILKNRLDSEECVNDTWVRTWNSIPPQRPRLLKAFFAKITRNLSFDRYKALTAEKRGGGEIELALEELGDCLSYESDVESHVTSSELADVINRFLRAKNRFSLGHPYSLLFQLTKNIPIVLYNILFKITRGNKDIDIFVTIL